LFQTISITALFDGIANSTEAPSEQEMSKKKVLVFFNIGTSVADPDPGSGAFLTAGSGIREG
jgi:hypothetical protein